jgi:hypothetical protein
MQTSIKLYCTEYMDGTTDYGVNDQEPEGALVCVRQKGGNRLNNLHLLFVSKDTTNDNVVQSLFRICNMLYNCQRMGAYADLVRNVQQYFQSSQDENCLPCQGK